jgi:phosphoribosylpyrophosphate synthetase
MITMDKVRDKSAKNKVKSIQLRCAPEMMEGHTAGDFLAGMTCIIVDDMIDTCGTVKEAVAKLMSYVINDGLLAFG